MIGRKFSSLLAAAVVSLGVACVVLLAGAGNALACVSDTDGDCFHPNYHIQRTDGTLAEWTGPGTGRIVTWLGGDGTAVEVVCETTGQTEDGQPYVVWDQLDDGNYVYGYYLDTPGDGYTPALGRCPGPGGGPNPAPPPPRGGQPPPNKFNAAGAAAWARANATGWPIFANNGFFFDDCTDFVSRAMNIGGGMPERDVVGRPPGNRTDDHNWYVVPPVVGPGHLFASYSWSSAPHLLVFLRNAGLARQVSLQAARPGDLIFVHWGPGGNDPSPPGIDHVGMIVGNPGGQGGYNVQIAQHSSNKIENLSDWKKANPNLQYSIYSMYYH